MDALGAAIDALFADPNIGRDAVYAREGGAPRTVRVVARRPDTMTTFADARIWSETALFDVRVREVASPRPGDATTLGAESFVIQGEPVRDRERLVWTVEARPA